MPDGARYRFQPLERRGVLLGLDAGQLGVVLAGITGSVVLRSIVGGAAGTAAAVVFVVVAAALAVWRTEGRPVAVWARLAVAWLARPGTHRPALSGVPTEGITGTTVARTRRVSLAPPGIELFEHEGLPGDTPLGVIHDRRRGTWAGVVAVRGRPYSLLDPADQAGRLDLWRGVLGALARPGSAIRLVQWVQRSGPAPLESLCETARGVETERAGPARSAQIESYQELVHRSLPTFQGHDAWLLVAVEPRRRTDSEGPPRQGGGRAAAVETLRRELRFLEGQLRTADLDAALALDLGELAAILEAGGDVRPRRHRAADDGAWPLAREERWGHVRADGAWHATYWVAEWPRVDVGPDFLLPLLIGSGRRSVSLLLSPVPADRALRDVRSSLTADVADSELRQKAGFLPSARREKENEGTARREAELAEGHSEYRFSGYVTVSAGDAGGLQGACAELEQAAQGSHLELRRLYGRQAEALTWTLPLGRGLR